MTNITKAAQDAIEAIEWLLRNIRRDAPQLSGKAMGNAEACTIALRAALQDKAGEVRDGVARYRMIRDGLVYIEPHESGEIYVAGETGVYTKSGDEFDAAIDAIAASKQKG